ncbi:hypothetical protein K438DRAFT_1984685 [Mycena galopus ATCC 62051]|nr:hypothetical protein K438DRAFT_1984685 [Mycena galopus ATCC 62051]
MFCTFSPVLLSPRAFNRAFRHSPFVTALVPHRSPIPSTHIRKNCPTRPPPEIKVPVGATPQAAAAPAA